MRRHIHTLTNIVFAALCFGTQHIALAQGKADSSATFAHGLIMKSLLSLTDYNTYAIEFEGLAQGLKDPKQIFNLPSYEVHRGGHIYADKDKFEMKMGSMKGLSDGKQVVYIDEQEKMMFVDSVRTKPNMQVDAEQLLAEEHKVMHDLIGADSISSQSCSYLGKENLKGKLCHKVRATFKGQVDTHFLYWIEVQSQQMLLMGEWTGANYNAYWISKISDTPPKGYNYSVNLPSTKMKNFYGFEVLDNRFTKVETEQALGHK